MKVTWSIENIKQQITSDITLITAHESINCFKQKVTLHKN